MPARPVRVATQRTETKHHCTLPALCLAVKNNVRTATVQHVATSGLIDKRRYFSALHAKLLLLRILRMHVGPSCKASSICQCSSAFLCLSGEGEDSRFNCAGFVVRCEMSCTVVMLIDCACLCTRDHVLAHWLWRQDRCGQMSFQHTV